MPTLTPDDQLRIREQLNAPNPGQRRPFDWEDSAQNLKAIGESIEKATEPAPLPLTLRQRLARDRAKLLEQREVIDQKVIRINELIDDIDRDPGLAARYAELLIAVNGRYLERP